LGSANLPNGFALLSLSFGLGPTTAAFVGPTCLDVLSPGYTVLFFLLDAAGNVHWSPSVPADPNWLTFPPYFMNALTLDLTGFSVPKTVRLGFESADAYDPIPATTPRAMHSATALYASPFDRRYEVLIAGGATGTIILPTPLVTTTLFSPLDRTFRTGP